MPYGIYAYVRKKTGLPFVMVLTKGGAWTKNPEMAHHLATKLEVEHLIAKIKPPPDSKNWWWYESIDEATELPS